MQTLCRGVLGDAVMQYDWLYTESCIEGGKNSELQNRCIHKAFLQSKRGHLLSLHRRMLLFFYWWYTQLSIKAFPKTLAQESSISGEEQSPTLVFYCDSGEESLHCLLSASKAENQPDCVNMRRQEKAPESLS